MLINIRTNRTSTEPSNMNTSDKIDIDTIIKSSTKFLDKGTQKLLLSYNIMKTKIYPDYREGVWNEETSTYDLSGDIIADFHPNVKLLYTEAEQQLIKTFLNTTLDLMTQYTALSKIENMFDPIQRLDNLTQ